MAEKSEGIYEALRMMDSAVQEYWTQRCNDMTPGSIIFVDDPSTVFIELGYGSDEEEYW